MGFEIGDTNATIIPGKDAKPSTEPRGRRGNSDTSSVDEQSSTRDDKRKSKRERREQRRRTEHRNDFDENFSDDGKYEEEEEPMVQRRSGRNASLNPNNAASRGMQFKKQYDEIVKTSNTHDARLLTPLNGFGNKKVDSSLTIVIYVSPIGNDLFVHPIILESKTSPIKVKNRSNRNRRDRDDYDSDLSVKRHLSTYDGVDTAFRDAILNYVRQDIRVSGNYVYTDVTIVPAGMDMTDIDNVRRVVFLADNANFTIANADEVFSADSVGKNSQLRAMLSFNQETQELDLLGTAIRTDFTVELNVQTRDTSNSDDVIFSTSDGDIARIHGFVNAGWVGTEDDVNRVSLRDLDNSCFVPEINIADIDTYCGQDGAEFDKALLALSCIPVLNTDGNYLRTFEENSREDNRSVAAFANGMEWPDDKIPAGLTDIDDDPKKLSRFLNRMFVSEDADVAILVREGGASFTLGKLFLDIANDQTGALDRLVVSMDNLTDDEFSERAEKAFKGDLTCRDVVTAVVRIPAGYIKDGKDKITADIIDTQYVLNKLQGNNLDLVYDWFECTSPDANNYTRDEADSKLIRVMDEVTGGQFVHTGYNYKCYLGGKYLSVSYETVQSSDMEVRIDSDRKNGERRRTRAGRRGERDSLRANTVRRSRRNTSDSKRRDRYVGSNYSY